MLFGIVTFLFNYKISIDTMGFKFLTDTPKEKKAHKKIVY